MDDASKINQLMALGKSAGERHLQQVVDEFLMVGPAPSPKFFS